MFDAIFKATNSSFQKGMTFCRSKYMKKVMKLLAFIFEQPSYPSVFIYCVNLHRFLILCSSKAMMFVKLYFRTSDIYLISLLPLDP